MWGLRWRHSLTDGFRHHLNIGVNYLRLELQLD
jgi:hypothetical protein